MSQTFFFQRGQLVPSFRFNWASDATFRISTFQKGPSHFTQLRISIKSCTDSLPRRTGSSVLLHRCELSVIWCRPWSVQQRCGSSRKHSSWFSCVFGMIKCWIGLMWIWSQSHCGSDSHWRCFGYRWRGFWRCFAPRLPWSGCHRCFVGP